MTYPFSRRTFIKTSCAVVAGSALGSVMNGCANAATSPMTGAHMVSLTASQVVTAIRNGHMSAEAYIKVLIARAELLSDLNCIITLNKDGATKAAREIDVRRAKGDNLPALAGLPIVIKDNINTRDLPTTGGTSALKNARPASNAPTLERLVDAGAIVFGKSNMHELAFGATNTNLTSFAGIAHNPYDRRRVPGGSSGGTAVAIAARIVPAGLGTDTGGSVRIPASLCGLAGLRPSVGNGGTQRRYDGSGVLPISHTRDTIGPMARTVGDVALLDSAMTGQSIATPISLRGLRLGVPSSFWSGIDSGINATMQAAMKKLANAGVTLVNVDIIGLRELTAKAAPQIALHEAHDDIPAYLRASGIHGITLGDIANGVASPDVKLAMNAVLHDVMAADYGAAMTEYRPRMQALYSSYFASNCVSGMLFPTEVVPAPLIDATNGSGKISIAGSPPVDTFATLIRNTDPGSTSGVPGITLAAGLTQDGLPVGLGLDGPIGSDRTLLGIGLSIEVLLGDIPAPNL